METWTRRTYVCNSDTCDAWLEITTKNNIIPRQPVTCPCGTTPNLVSEADATITTPNEKEQQMQDIQLTKLSNDYQVEALEFKPNGETVTHYLTKADINEIFRKKQFTESFLKSANMQIQNVLDKLCAHGWYDSNVTKEKILEDLCYIFSHEAKATLNWSATIRVEGSTDVLLSEVDSFDLRYFINDELSVDSNNGDTEINTYYVEDIDEEEWA